MVRLTFTLFVLSHALASYRVFKLRVESLDDKGKITKTREVSSVLDHLQYEHYYGLGAVRVELLDSWFCPGDTGRLRTLCARPKERAPSWLEDPKRILLPYGRQPVIP